MDADVVRASGKADRARPPRAPRGWMIVSIGVVLGVLALASGTVGAESDRTAVTVPSIPDPTPADLSLRQSEPVASALDALVPGMSGTLVMTVAGPDGIEVWRWETGEGAQLSKSATASGLFDASPDPSGAWVIGIQRQTELPLLQAGVEAGAVPVFWGAESYSWHLTDTGAVAWIAPLESEVTFQIGRHRADGISFKPGPVIATAPGDSHRLVAFDELGFVLERVSSDRQFSVMRVDVTGVTTGVVAGRFVAVSPGGQVAVSDGTATQFRRDAAMTLGATLNGGATSASWSANGSRLAVTDIAGDTIDIVDGFARLTLTVGEIRPWILAWSPDGRFVLVGGEADGEKLITFVDTASLEIRTVFLDGQPIAAVVIP